MSYSGYSSHHLRSFFVSNGLPWTPDIKSYQYNDCFDSVEIIKLLTNKEWDELLVGEKKYKKQIALIVFHDIKEKKLNSPNCSTAVSLNNPNSELSLPANTKKPGPSSGTTYDNVELKKLIKMGFTQNRSKNNKPNKNWKECVD